MTGEGSKRHRNKGKEKSIIREALIFLPWDRNLYRRPSRLSLVLSDNRLDVTLVSHIASLVLISFYFSLYLIASLWMGIDDGCLLKGIKITLIDLCKFRLIEAWYLVVILYNLGIFLIFITDILHVTDFDDSNTH